MQQKMLHVILLLCVPVSYARIINEAAGCSISVNEDLHDPQPLILLSHSNSSSAIDSFPHPEDDDGTISFEQGGKVDFACPGGTIIENGKNTFQNHLQATCVYGTIFLVNNKHALLNTLNCSKIPAHAARYTGKTCAGTLQEIEIGVEIKSRFIRHILVCFDKDTQNTAYTEFHLTSSIEGYQVGYSRPAFKHAGFYTVTATQINKLYERNTQRKTINGILGLDAGNNSVIHRSNSFYLARGHLTAKADFVYGAQQRLTFYYINAVPQWQTFNAGNWKTLEGNCRNFASKKSLDLVVYTGTYGIAKLNDTKGVEQELYLHKTNHDKGIPVPEIMWKVLYHPKTEAGIAFIGINNPYVKDVKRFLYCEDVCSKVHWLTWTAHDIKLGYSYCCDVNDFRKTITSLPNFNVTKLLI